MRKKLKNDSYINIFSLGKKFKKTGILIKKMSIIVLER